MRHIEDIVRFLKKCNKLAESYNYMEILGNLQVNTLTRYDKTFKVDMRLSEISYNNQLGGH